MKLTEMSLLKGKQYRVSMTEFRQQPGDIISKVQMGAEFTVTKQGKAVAIIASPEPSAIEIAKALRNTKSAY